MEQIVNPAFFYWASVFSALKVVSLALTIICIVVLVCMILYEYCGLDDDDESAISFRKNMKRIAVAAMVMVIVMIFVPSKQTMIEMQIAKMATGDNISAVIQKITDVAKEIIESAK